MNVSQVSPNVPECPQLDGCSFDGIFLDRIATYTERERGPGYGGTFAVPLEGITLEKVKAARAEQRARFAAAQEVRE